MNPVLRNILAVTAGLIVGSMANMGTLYLGNSIIPLPEGLDINDMEALKAAIPDFEPKNFVTPFMAHAIGTLVGAFLTALIAAGNKMSMAMIVGILFLCGGAYMVFQLPAPMWFNVLDLAGAYIPMAWLGCKIAGSFARK